MNSITKLLAGVLTGLFLWACAGHAASGSPTNTVEVRAGTVFINGNRVNRTTKLAEYEKLLGKPDRVTAGKNTIYTYDKLGIRLYQRPGEATVLSISLDFVNSQFNFSPTNCFKGAFIVDGKPLRSDFAKAGLAGLRGVQIVQIDPSFKPLELPVIMASQGKIILTFQYLASTTQLDGVGIAWQENGEQSSPATRSRSVRSEANRAPAAAGSGR